MKILIVEDSGLARKMLRSECRKFLPDAEYTPAVNGKEGAELFTQAASDSAPFDLVFVDQLMPEMDGLESAKLMLEQKPDAYLVMVTANIQAATEEEARQIGIRQFAHKPISTEKMESILAQWSQDKSS